MKRGLIFTVIVASAVIAAFAVSQHVSAFPAPPPAPAPLRIVVLGDSLALGTGAADPVNGLTFRIYRALSAGRPGSEITNFAIGGTRASDVRRLEVASLDPRATDLVLLVVGGNDVVRRTPAATFAREYTSLLTAIRRRVPRATVVAFGVPDVARSPLFADSRAKTEALSRADDVAVRVAAAGNGATFVDLFSYTHHAATTQDFFSSDDFHPSDAGYARLAAFALPVVTRALARRSSRESGSGSRTSISTHVLRIKIVQSAESRRYGSTHQHLALPPISRIDRAEQRHRIFDDSCHVVLSNCVKRPRGLRSEDAGAISEEKADDSGAPS